MTCRECLHFEVCDSGRHIGEHVDDDGVYTDGVERECTTFKNRHLYIEVPCRVGDRVRILGWNEPCMVAAIHFYIEGSPQISLTRGNVTTTMTTEQFQDCKAILK